MTASAPTPAGATHCWRGLVASPDALGRDGIAFLRRAASHAAVMESV